MVGDKRANRAIGMGDSILMMMEGKFQEEERKAYKQEIDKFSIHQAIRLKNYSPRKGK
jgi:hypothetical protein